MFQEEFRGGLDWFGGAATATAGQTITTDWFPVGLIRQMRMTLLGTSGGSTAQFASATVEALLAGATTAVSLSSGTDDQTHLSVDLYQFIAQDTSSGQIGSLTAWGADKNSVLYPYPTMGVQKVRLVLVRDATVATFVGNCHLSYVATTPMLNPTIAAAVVTG